MQTLKQNKLLVWILALITAFCAFIGVMLPTNNVARADASFPDVSSWEEKEPDSFKNIESLSGEDLQDAFDNKVYRIYLKNAAESDCYSFYITTNMTDETVAIASFYGYGFDEVDIGKITSETDSDISWTYKLGYSEEVGFFYDFMICFPANVSKVEVEYSYFDSKISLDEVIAEGYLVELVKSEDSSDIDNENKFPYFDKIADYVNEHTGLAVTGSFVGTFLIGIVVYLLFIKK